MTYLTNDSELATLLEMEKQSIYTDQAPKAIGCYSQAIKCDQTVYTSGQLPICRQTMAVIDADLTEQVNQVFNYIEAIAIAAGGSLSQLVKLNAFVLDIDDAAIINQAMEKRFTAPYPARATVAVNALSKQVSIEIEAIMICDEH